MKKVILVEDDIFLVKVYKTKLAESGLESQIVTDSTMAIDEIRKTMPGLIVLDIIMPLKNGLDILKELKSDDALKEIPVIILSTLSQDSDRAVGIKLGAVEYISKTDVKIEDIIDKIKNYLR